MCCVYAEHEEATEKFSRVSKVRETDRVSTYSECMSHYYDMINNV